MITSQTRRTDLKADQLAAIIRATLAAVANIAKSYDLGSNSRYAANVMFFVPNLETEPFFEHEIWKVVRFKPRWWDFNKEQVAGVLLLKKELSASASNGLVNDIQHDIGFIAAKKRVANKWQDILPGGPRAFANGVEKKRYAAHGYDDVSKISRLNQEDFALEPDVLAELRNYYSPAGEGKDVMSFLALTLPRTQNTFDKTPLGVLNVHSNAPNILGGSSERYEVFAQLMAPFISEIAWAAELWANEKGVRLEKLES